MLTTHLLGPKRFEFLPQGSQASLAFEFLRAGRDEPRDKGVLDSEVAGVDLLAVTGRWCHRLLAGGVCILLRSKRKETRNTIALAAPCSSAAVAGAAAAMGAPLSW